jgi:diketogulonate reductase-like aldo/keto reductase
VSFGRRIAKSKCSHNDPAAGLKGSLERLGVSYVDLYLMHFPFGMQGVTQRFDHVEVSPIFKTK